MTPDDRDHTGSGTPGDETVLTKRVVGFLRANNVRFERCGIGPVAAAGNVSFSRGGCGPVLSGGDVSFHQGGCGPVLAKGDVTIRQGGCQTMIAGGGATIGERAFVGVVLSPKVTVQAGAKVLLGTREAAVMGAAVGLVVALLSRRSRAR